MIRIARRTSAPLALAIACSALGTCESIAGPARLFDQAAKPPSAERFADSVLADGYQQLLRTKDQSRFVRQMTSWYSQQRIESVLLTGDEHARRGAVVILGHAGDFSANAALALALQDTDPVVRRFATEAMRVVWFRAGTEEQNELLHAAYDLIATGDNRSAYGAIELASQVIDAAPDYAEAYHQRGAAQFAVGEYRQALADYRKAIELNPYHFDAASGMANCHLKLGGRRGALESFRLSQQINPGDGRVRSAILSLERSSE